MIMNLLIVSSSDHSLQKFILKHKNCTIVRVIYYPCLRKKTDILPMMQHSIPFRAAV